MPLGIATEREFAERRALAQNSAMNSAVELSAIEPENELVTFEQPLTERMRTFLRVEFLYEQTLFHVEEPTDFGARAAVSGLLEIVTILGRGDVGSGSQVNVNSLVASTLDVPDDVFNTIGLANAINQGLLSFKIN